ncbi:MAG: FIST N-terminal domain-containing protein, partial [Campylobacterales bacterium]
MKIINHVYEDREGLIQFAEANALSAAPSLLIQIFFSGRSAEAVYRVRNELLSLFPKSAILATSTAGVIGDGAMRDDTILISFSVFEHSAVRTLGFRDQSTQDISASLAAHLITPETKLLVLFANTFRFEASGLLRQLSRAFPHIAVAGGNAGDDYRFEHCEVFSDHADDCDVVFAAVDSDRLNVSTRYLLNWQSIGREMKVTKASGGEVFEIDGRNPVEVYRHYLGDDVADNILQYGIEFPIIFTSDGVDIARAAVAVNEETGSITFAGEVPEHAGVRFGYANIEHIEHLNKAMLSEEFTTAREGIYVYSCGSRRQMLGGFLNDEL